VLGFQRERLKTMGVDLREGVANLAENMILAEYTEEIAGTEKCSV
jgi:hypothetical protein